MHTNSTFAFQCALAGLTVPQLCLDDAVLRLASAASI